jgi:hypothetical protein
VTADCRTLTEEGGTLTRRARSSAGQSSGLIIRRSQVRVLAGPLKKDLEMGAVHFLC